MGILDEVFQHLDELFGRADFIEFMVVSGVSGTNKLDMFNRSGIYEVTKNILDGEDIEPLIGEREVVKDFLYKKLRDFFGRLEAGLGNWNDLRDLQQNLINCLEVETLINELFVYRLEVARKRIDGSDIHDREVELFSEVVALSYRKFHERYSETPWDILRAYWFLPGAMTFHYERRDVDEWRKKAREVFTELSMFLFSKVPIFSYLRDVSAKSVFYTFTYNLGKRESVFRGEHDSALLMRHANALEEAMLRNDILDAFENYSIIFDIVGKELLDGHTEAEKLGSLKEAVNGLAP